MTRIIRLTRDELQAISGEWAEPMHLSHEDIPRAMSPVVNAYYRAGVVIRQLLQHIAALDMERSFEAERAQAAELAADDAFTENMQRIQAFNEQAEAIALERMAAIVHEHNAHVNTMEHE